LKPVELAFARSGKAPALGAFQGESLKRLFMHRTGIDVYWTKVLFRASDGDMSPCENARSRPVKMENLADRAPRHYLLLILNRLRALRRPIFKRSAALIETPSNHSAASRTCSTSLTNVRYERRHPPMASEG